MNAVKEAYMKPNDFNKKGNTSFTNASQNVDSAYNKFMNSLGLNPSNKLSSKNPNVNTKEAYETQSIEASTPSNSSESFTPERRPKPEIERSSLSFESRRSSPKHHIKKNHSTELPISLHDSSKSAVYLKSKPTSSIPHRNTSSLDRKHKFLTPLEKPPKLKRAERSPPVAETKDLIDAKRSRHERSFRLGVTSKNISYKQEDIQGRNTISKQRANVDDRTLNTRVTKSPTPSRRSMVQPTNRPERSESPTVLKQKLESPKQKVVTEVKTFTQVVSPVNISREDPLAAYFNRKDQYKVVVKKKLVEVLQPPKNESKEKTPQSRVKRYSTSARDSDYSTSRLLDSVDTVRDENIPKPPNKSKRNSEDNISSKDKLRRVIRESNERKIYERGSDNVSTLDESKVQNTRENNKTTETNCEHVNDIGKTSSNGAESLPKLCHSQERVSSTDLAKSNPGALANQTQLPISFVEKPNSTLEVSSTEQDLMTPLLDESLVTQSEVSQQNFDDLANQMRENDTSFGPIESKLAISSCEAKGALVSSIPDENPSKTEATTPIASIGDTIPSLHESSSKHDKTTSSNSHISIIESSTYVNIVADVEGDKQREIADRKGNKSPSIVSTEYDEAKRQNSDTQLHLNGVRRHSASLSSAGSPLLETPCEDQGIKQGQAFKNDSNVPIVEKKERKHQISPNSDLHEEKAVTSYKRDTLNPKQSIPKSERKDELQVPRDLISTSEQYKANRKPSSKETSKSLPVLRGAEKAVRDAIETYRKYFKDKSFDNLAKMKNSFPRIILELPAEGVKEVYPLMIPIKPGTRDEEDKEEYNPITDLISTVEVIVEQMLSENLASHFGDEKEGTIRNLKKARNRKEGLEFVSAVRDFNVLMRKFKESGQIQACAKRIKVPSIELSNHILYQVYSRTVAPQADSLKEYEAFSNQVYGEINPILISEFIERTGIQSNHVFLDMGCGIGNVVLQVAAQTGCESHGIEIMDIPARLAKLQLKEFKARMNYYHISHGHVDILHGDFLESPEIVDILRRVDVVLVNNYAFDSDLNQRLLQLFLDLKEGTKIITLKSYVPLDHKITLRNAASVESILTVQRYPYWSESVSWTNNGGEYFIHTVDRQPLYEFWRQVEENGGIDAATEGPIRRTTRSRK